MTTYISNAFSLSMLPDGATVRTSPVNLPAIAKKLSSPVSVVGHADTAAVFSEQLGIPVAHNRVSISLTWEDTLYVGQLVGGRLPEGATTLPEGFEIKWVRVAIDAPTQALTPWWTRRGSSIYGAIDRAADAVADLVNGKVKVVGDAWGNPHWEIEAPGFYGNLYDG